MTRTKGETRTIQTWPGGASFEYRGDPDGPPNQRSLRAGHYQARVRCTVPGCEWYYTPRRTAAPDELPTPTPCATCDNTGYINNPTRNPWRKGTADEWRTIRIALRAELYQRNMILACMSSLVGDLLTAASEIGGDLGEAFEIDQIRNVYRDFSDADADTCRAYASDHGLDLPDVPTIDCPKCEGVGYHAETNEPCTCDYGEIPDPGADEDDSRHGWLTEARQVCTEHAQDNPQEPYEWYLVDSWLCDQLHAIGEVTIDNGYGHFWGRTCTGQGLIMDGTLQQIAANFERD